MLRRITLSFLATKQYNHATKRVVSLHPTIMARHVFPPRPSSIARHFHVISSQHSSCDWGSPCNCSECMRNAWRPVCDICKARPTVNQSSALASDRKGVSSYDITCFCEQCWEKYAQRKREQRLEEEQKLASRQKRVDKMLEHVRRLDAREKVPIAYAVEKIMGCTRFSNSRQWYQRHIISSLSRDLQIVKVRNRYICNKRRVDAMDFNLWYNCERLEIDV
jgi:hypothetical protein